MMSVRMPPFIFCPRCGSRIQLTEDHSPETMKKIGEQGYTGLPGGCADAAWCASYATSLYQHPPPSASTSTYTP